MIPAADPIPPKQESRGAGFIPDASLPYIVYAENICFSRNFTIIKHCVQHFNDFTKSSESQRLTCVTVQAGGPGEVAPLAELLLTCSATDSPKEIFMPAGLRCVNPVHRAYGATDPFREIFHTVGTVSASSRKHAYDGDSSKFRS